MVFLRILSSYEFDLALFAIILKNYLLAHMTLLAYWRHLTSYLYGNAIQTIYKSIILSDVDSG